MTADNHRPPLPEGYIMRPAKMDDVEAATGLLNATMQALAGRDECTVEELALEWETPGFSPEEFARLVISPDGEIVGFIDFFDTNEPHVIKHTWACIRPDHRGQGLLAHMLAWSDDLAQQRIGLAPDDARVTLMTSSLTTDTAFHEGFRQQGYQLVRHFYIMQIEFDGPPPEPQWPAGVTVRPMVPGQDEETIIWALDEAFKDHWGHVDTPLEQLCEQWQHEIENDPTFDPTLWYIVEQDDETAGAAICRPVAENDPECGYVRRLGILRPFRRNGLALALLLHIFGEFYRRGKQRVRLGVDAYNLTGALRLYENAGMHVAEEYSAFQKELRPGVDLVIRGLDDGD